MGGEKNSSALPLLPVLGSPPHGRGKDYYACGENIDHGITPAWAGKRVSMISFFFTGWDHPRMGGEKEARDYPKEEVWGSPPHGRGKVFLAGGFFVSSGITPAWAGKSILYYYYYNKL